MNKILFFILFAALMEKSFCFFDPVISLDVEKMRRISLVAAPAGWHLKKIDFTNLVEKSAYNVRPITIAVIDSGIDWTHPALKNHLYTNKNEIPNNGIDDDGNGYIDDIHGFNFLDHTNNTKDDNGHGTHVSGVIAADCNLDQTMCGILKRVNILPLKFIDKNGNGPTSAAVEAIKYAVKMKVDIINASFGSETYSQELFNAIKLAENAGIVFVTAAGNYSNNIDLNPMYPASFNLNNIISVAATDIEDNLDLFSNFGMSTVSVAAPGSDIYSTFKDGKYETLSGTSMATPIMTGIVGLMLQFQKSDSRNMKNAVNKICTNSEFLFDKIKCHGTVSIRRIFK